MTGVGTRQPRIGHKLTKLMAEKGFTAMDVAFALDVTETTVRRWRENRAAPHDNRQVKRLANLLGVEVRDLYDTQEAA